MTTDRTSTTGSDAYDRFEARVERITNLAKSRYMLYWDQEVVMPEEGKRARSKQISTLSSVTHDLLTDDEMVELLDELADADLDPGQQAVYDKIRQWHEREASVSPALIEDISETKATALQKIDQASVEDDFSVFAPSFERLVELQREHAEQIDPDDDPYAVLFREYDPFIDLETVDRIVTRVRDELAPLIEAIGASDVDLATDPFPGTHDADALEALCRDVLDGLGFDWEHGRLDPARYPLTTGTQYDVRIGMPFEESALLGTVLATVHEFGQASYTLGLPREHYGTPLGDTRGRIFHKTQGQLWKNRIGRSKAFWEQFLPTVKERFPGTDDVTPQTVYEAANQVYDDNVIRLNADELTHKIHVGIRYEIERDLIRGDLEVEEVPQVWTRKYEQYLGVRPETDAEGCLQATHWANGSFGYFPTISLGSVLAAQLYAAAEADLGDPREYVRDGNAEAVVDWFREKVYRYGKRYTTPELIDRVTGEQLTADYYLDYVTDKYGDLYDLDGY